MDKSKPSAQDEDGQIWVTANRPGGTTHPLCRIFGTDIHCYGKSEGIPLSGGDSLARDPSGNLWVGGDTALVRWSAGIIQALSTHRFASSQGIEGVKLWPLLLMVLFGLGWECPDTGVDYST